MVLAHIRIQKVYLASAMLSLVSGLEAEQRSRSTEKVPTMSEADEFLLSSSNPDDVRRLKESNHINKRSWSSGQGTAILVEEQVERQAEITRRIASAAVFFLLFHLFTYSRENYT